MRSSGTTAARKRRAVVLSLALALAGPGLVGAAAAPAPACNGFTWVNRTPFGTVALRAEVPSRPPAVFVSELSERRVRRLDGATGKPRWTAVDDNVDMGVLRAGAGANVVSVAPDDCGTVTLTARDAVTGARRWTRTQPGHGDDELGDGHFLLAGSGDLNADGWADVAVLETAADETVGAAGRNLSVSVGHPSGQTNLPTGAWRAGYFVLNGRTGKPLVQQDLGSGTGPFPILAWAGNRVVVAVPASTSTTVTAVGPHGPLWSRTLGAAVTDVDLRPVAGRVLVLQGASHGTTVFGGTLDALDLATGAVTWTAPVGGTDQVSVGSRGEVYVSGQFPGGRVVRLDQATGLPVWVQPVAGVSEVTSLADFDGDGLAEAFAAGVASNAVLSAKDGHSLLALAGIEDAYAVGDLDGDKHDDLFTVEWDDVTPGNSSPVVTVRLRHGLGAVRWTRKVSVCPGGSLRVTSTAGAQGSIVLSQTGCPYVVLASRTGQERWRIPG
jgi:outer membrane protein assembly factor BamB